MYVTFLQLGEHLQYLLFLVLDAYLRLLLHAYKEKIMFKIMLYIYYPLPFWGNIFKFSLTWSCVPLPQSTTSSGWKLLMFGKFVHK